MNSRTIYLPEVVPPGPPGIGGLRLGNTLLQAKQGENGEDEKETDAERRTRRINLYKAWKRRVYNRMTMNPAEDIATNPAYKWRLSVKDRLKSEGTQPWTEIDHVVLYDANKQDLGQQTEEPTLLFKKDAEFFKTASGKAPIIRGVKSIQELFKELATIIKPEKPDGPGKCIKHLTIHAHGMFDLKDKMGGFKIGEEQVTAYKGSTSAEQFGILLEDALCADATINLWVCWGANHDFLASLGRLANATVRGTSGLFQVEYDDDPTKEKTKPIMWIVPDGIDEFKPPKNFPDDKERDLEGLGKKDWGETKPATGIGEQQKDSRYVSGKTLWD